MHGIATEGTDDHDEMGIGKTLLETNARSEQLIGKLLLTLARSENAVTEWHPVDLAELVESALSTCTEEIRARGITVHHVLGPGQVVGDIELLEQMVLNLVQNAVRHNDAQAGQVWLATRPAGADIWLEVSNTGRPGREHDVTRMFEPFVRLARQRTGPSQGLGLSIVRSVVQSHGGTVTASPREDGGLIIVVQLPHADAHGDKEGLLHG